MSNRLAHLTTTMPNDEFYLMGRIPRTPTATGGSDSAGT